MLSLDVSQDYLVAVLAVQVIGLRVNQIYDIDHKTYLLKLQKPDTKVVLLIESSSRIHTTEYDWPKNPAPSSFAMKLRKHLRNKRLESIHQLGIDRIVDMTFGCKEAAHHLIVELYDRGNIVLTDTELTILNILRPRKDGEDTRLVVGERYPVDSARAGREPPMEENLRQALVSAKQYLPLKKILNPLLDCGGGILEHELLLAGLASGSKIGKDIHPESDLSALLEALKKAQFTVTEKSIARDKSFKGFIIKTVGHLTKGKEGSEEIEIFQEFHPILYAQHAHLPYNEYSSFNEACDEFFSKKESIELDKKALQKEKEALKKLENVKKDHSRRLKELQVRQEEDCRKGQLIELNKDLVEAALLVVRSAVANQIDWKQIRELLDEAQGLGDPVACAIRDLKLHSNLITLWLSDPYDCDEDDMLLDSDEEREEGQDSAKMRPMAVDIDLDLSALANARKYYNKKRQAAQKEQKTIDASVKAIKSAERKTQQQLKEVSITTNINKARKVHWFEKYLWFISSENYLVIGGRDSQQNEILVKRYLKPKDVYLHADIHGASSIVIKNPTGANVPPRTLNEAGTMAMSYSHAWEEKVITSAWWVWGSQVSKTAPAGEYLTTGAFMIRGKKNFLPPSHLIFGFGFLFRLEEGSVSRHANERRVRTHDEEISSVISDVIDKLHMNTLDENEEIDMEDEISSVVSDVMDKLNVNVLDEKEKEIDLDCDNESREEDASHEGSCSEGNIPCVHDSPRPEAETCDLSSPEDMCSDSVEKDIEFPDTVVEMAFLKGDQFLLKAKAALDATAGCLPMEEDSTHVVYIGDDRPLVIHQNSENRKQKVKTRMKNPQAKLADNTNVSSTKEVSKPEGCVDRNPVCKRGQKTKLKKAKKYQNMDEEEKELRQQLLQSSRKQKEAKKGKGAKKTQSGPPKPPPMPLVPKEAENTAADDLVTCEPEMKKEEDEEEEDAANFADDMVIINALTATPYLEDELLYAVPVCAPYTAMSNYRYKVKLTPGGGKKGKATKTALNLFLSDKSVPGREKDLLRAVKDYDLSKNLPGKVKVSAPNIIKMKKS